MAIEDMAYIVKTNEKTRQCPKHWISHSIINSISNFSVKIDAFNHRRSVKNKQRCVKSPMRMGSIFNLTFLI